MSKAVQIVERDKYIDVISQLRDEGFHVCIDITSVDYLRAITRESYPEGIQQERFELVTNLLSHEKKERIRLRVPIPESDPVVPSLCSFYPGSEFMEREVYDLMGIVFAGHPDMTRVLMPDDWEGHPLRKDYDEGRVPVQFKYTAHPYDTSRAQPGSVTNA